MKLKKKTAALCAVLVGASIFATTAFADMAIGSGYYSLKDTIKTTAAHLTGKSSGFTAGLSMSITCDGNVIAVFSANTKYDLAAEKTETTNSSTDKNGTFDSYSYRDMEKYITYDDEADTYYVHHYSMPQEGPMLSNPFEEDIAADLETIVDAFVGSMKDIVQVEESDGKKMYMGNLSGSQIPALANAVSSFMLKYSFFDEYNARDMGFPSLQSDVAVTSVSGKAIENESGILESLLGSASVSGKDKDGVDHSFTFDFTVDLTNVDATVVTEPDLSGKTVEESTASVRSAVSTDMVGTYKSDVVVRGEEGFTKVGQRTITITAVDGDSAAGTYTATYTDGRADESFDFTAVYDEERSYGDLIFDYTDANGETKHGIISESGYYGQNLYVNMDVVFDDDGGYRSYSDLDNEFIRVFE